MDSHLSFFLFLISLIAHNVAGQVCEKRSNHIPMCDEGCDALNLMNIKDFQEGILVDNSTNTRRRCRITLQADPGYGMKVEIGTSGLLTVGSCGDEPQSCGDANYFSINDGARSKCKCDTEFEPRAPGADTNLFVTMESTITLEFAGVGITALLASVFGCPQSDLFTGSKVIPTYLDMNPVDIPESYRVNLTCPPDHMLAKKFFFIENQCIITNAGGVPIGRWTGEPVGCTRIKCPAPAIITNGNYTPYQSGAYRNDQEIHYICDPGYEMIPGSGDVTRKCIGVHGEGFVFSGSEPSCKKIDCGSPPNGNDYSLIGSRLGTKYGATRDVKCYTGRERVGPETISCLEDGKWSEPPRCDVRRCEGIPTITNGGSEVLKSGIDGNVDGYQAEHEFGCDEGFIMFGDSTVVCQENGTWSAEPECRAEFCTLVKLPQSSDHVCTNCAGNTHNRLNSTRTYQCKPLFLPQTEEVICQGDGHWSQPKPCTYMECEAPVDTDHGTWSYTRLRNGDTAQLQCETGYGLDDEDKILTCNINGEWINAPTCVAVDCGYPTSITQGLVLGSSQRSTTYKSVLKYDCAPGYKMTSAFNQVTCEETGRWSTLPTCQMKDCGVPESHGIENGVNEEYYSTLFGVEIKYSCNEGFMFTGPQSRVCQADGTWTEIPECVVVDCMQPVANIESGDLLSSNGTGLGAVVKYMCAKYGLTTMIVEGRCDRAGDWIYPNCSEYVKESMLYIYIGCAGGLVLLILLVILIVGLCFRHRERKRRLNLKELRGDAPLPGRLGDKSVSRRVDHCSNDSGLFIDADPENEHHSAYDERNGLLMKASWKPQGSPPGPYSSGSLIKPRSRYPIANGIQLDELSVDPSTYDNDDLENPLYGEQKTHRIPGSIKSAHSPNNLQHSPPGLPSPHISNLNVTQEPASPLFKYPVSQNTSPNPVVRGGRYNTNPKRLPGQELSATLRPPTSANPDYYGNSYSANTLPVRGNEPSAYL